MAVKAADDADRKTPTKLCDVDAVGKTEDVAINKPPGRPTTPSMAAVTAEGGSGFFVAGGSRCLAFNAATASSTPRAEHVVSRCLPRRYFTGGASQIATPM